MDLLGSILDAMDKPPSVSNEELALRKKRKEEMEKRKAAEQAMLKKFRNDVENKIAEFLKDNSCTKHEFKPMTKVFRSIIQDVADVAGVVVIAVGEEDVDRRIIMYKKEFVPCEEELQALRRGEVWDPQKALIEKEKRAREEEEAKIKPKNFKPAHNYKDKYSHLIGTTAAKAAAKRTETNKQYGFVPAENKKDVRSIEQTLADIQSKKRMKKDHPEASTS